MPVLALRPVDDMNLLVPAKDQGAIPLGLDNVVGLGGLDVIEGGVLLGGVIKCSLIDRPLKVLLYRFIGS